MEDPKSIQKRFEAAVKVIRSLPEDGNTVILNIKYECEVNFMVLFKNNNSNSLIILSLFHTGSYDLSDDMLVMLYSYYKQATVGPCNTLKPNSWDPIGKAKW